MDDYADIVAGARKDAENHPTYDSGYIRAAIRRPIAGRAPYVIHNMAQRQRENDYFAFKKHMTVTGHYRFDASKVL